MDYLTYTHRRRWKYRLTKPLAQPTRLTNMACATDYLVLKEDGLLQIRSGYCWDGPSGPALDTPTFMRASLVHDALYQLIRQGHLDPATARLTADRLMHKLCLADGMSRWRAGYSYWAVRLFGGRASQPETRQVPLNAVALTEPGSDLDQVAQSSR